MQVLKVCRIMNSALKMGLRAINPDKNIKSRRNHDRIAQGVAKNARVNRDGADATPSLKSMTITTFIATRRVCILGIRTGPMRRRGQTRGPRTFSVSVRWTWSHCHPFPVVTPTKIPRYQMEARRRAYLVAPPASIDRRGASKEQVQLPDEWGAASPKDKGKRCAAIDDYCDRCSRPPPPKEFAKSDSHCGGSRDTAPTPNN